MKYLFILIIGILFLGCTPSSYSFNTSKKNLQFKLPNKNMFVVPLSKPQYRYNSTNCTQNAYTLFDENKEYGKLFVEHISLTFGCDWNGLSRGYFTYELQRQLKLKTLRLENRVSVHNYEFSTYKVNNEEYIDVIFIYWPNQTTLILDYEGYLTKTLLEKLRAKIGYAFLDSPRLNQNYHYSLVRNNFFYKYFQGEVIRRTNP